MIKQIPDKDVINNLKIRADVFKNKECELFLIEIDKLIPLSQFLVQHRLDNSEALFCLYKKNGIDLYKSVILKHEGRKKIIEPPVVEFRDGNYFICDGMHRVFTAIKHNVRIINVLLIKNASLPLPGKPLNWSEVKITQTQMKVPQIFIDYVEDGYTGYSKELNDTQYFE